MTPERSKYLSDIGYEERVIRNQIDYHRSSLKLRKWLVSGKRAEDEDDISLYKSEIAGEKIVIKTLKRQLPAPVQCMSNKFIVKTFCVACKGKICDDENYCPKCGRKLR